jgi:hypothetical protein
MIIETFYKKLAIPDDCHLGKRVYKKLFYENAKLGVTDKKAFTNDIEEIDWIYTLKPETINISSYEDEGKEYHEIAIIQVALKETTRYKRIAQIIQRAIPYPVFIVFMHDSSIAFNVAMKRINRADSEKITIDEFHDTNWIDLEKLTDYESRFLESCDIKGFSYNNFFTFYSDIVKRIIALNCAELSGVFSVDSKHLEHDRAKVLNSIKKLQHMQTELRSELKKESQFNRKVELNVQIKNVSKQIEHYKACI